MSERPLSAPPWCAMCQGWKIEPMMPRCRCAAVDSERPLSAPKFFRGCEDPACKYGRSKHSHGGQWKAFWDSLTPKEQQSLRDKAQWEHMSLSAVAAEWGASNV